MPAMQCGREGGACLIAESKTSKKGQKKQTFFSFLIFFHKKARTPSAIFSKTGLSLSSWLILLFVNRGVDPS